MTHKQLVKAVYHEQITRFECINENCGNNCEECSENLVVEYESKIRVDERVKTLDTLLEKVKDYQFDRSDSFYYKSQAIDIEDLMCIVNELKEN